MTDSLALRTVGGTPLDFTPSRLVIAGYTGRDEVAVRRHIDELAEFGIAPPPQVPMFYPMPLHLLTTAPALSGPATLSSGEVEPVLLRCAGRWYLAVGSDHTDRELERIGVAEAKEACPKPIGAQVYPLSDDLAAVDLDDVTATCHVDGVPYQKGDLSGLRPFAELWTRALEAGCLPASDDDVAIFGGTLPLLAGEFVAGEHWVITLTLPGGTALRHEYRIDQSIHRSPDGTDDRETQP